MKKLLRFAFVMLAALTMNTSFAQTSLTEAVDFTVIDTEGQTWNLFELLDSGQHVVIDFFYTGWGSCPSSVPLLNATHEYFGCGDYDVTVIALSNSDNDAATIAYDTQYGVLYPTASAVEGGGAAVNNAYGISAYPTHIIIAPNHDIIEQDVWPISAPSDFIDPLENGGCVAHDCDGGSATLIASFEADNIDPCSDEDIQFTNSSEGDPISFQWTFEGGTPESSTDESPIVSYAIPGVYDVTLVVSKDFNQSTSLMEDYITTHNCIGIEDINMNNMRISPNPGDGNFQVSLPDNGTYEVQVYDIAGHMVYYTTLTAEHNNLNISNLNNGIYVISANNGLTQLKERVIIK